MATHVALLRGINVGGRNKVPMAGLREVVTSLGHTGVTTYIQSGNVLFTAAGARAREGASSRELAASLEPAIAEAFGIRSSVVVLSREELAKVLGDNPYPDEPNPKLVHVVFLNSQLPEDVLDRITAAESAAAAKGARDTMTAIGQALFVHTPDGFGTSELAQSLFRIISAKAKPGQEAIAATARNWATATKLLSLCDEK
jgi:uncharacterized protein (DUF1697 family)